MERMHTFNIYSWSILMNLCTFTNKLSDRTPLCGNMLQYCIIVCANNISVRA